jgi:phosphatidylinositol alpha-mannosyltransferase
MRIAIVSPYDFPYPGGVTKHITNLAESFRRQGHQVSIIAASSRAAEEMPPDVIRVSSFVIPVPYSGSVARISLSPWLTRRVRALLQRETFEVVHLHEPTTPTLPWAVAWQTRRLSPETALVGTFHAYRESVYFSHNCVRPIFCRLVDALDQRIAVSSAARDHVSAYSPSPCRVIPNGVDLALFGNPRTSLLPQFTDGYNILFVGRLEPRKGFRYLIRAYARVKKVLPQSRLLVVGPYTIPDRLPFEREMKQLGLTDVHFIGYVPDDELARYYHCSQVFCAPSTGFESFGMVLLEAMAAGTPIVASDIEGYRNVVTHQAEGLLVPPQDANALADALITILQQPELGRSMGQRGQTTAARYSWDEIADRVLDCYGEAIEQKRDANTLWSKQMTQRRISAYRDRATVRGKVG